MTNTVQKPFAAGYQAGLDGEPMKNSPYFNDTGLLHRLWYSGYMEAVIELRLKEFEEFDKKKTLDSPNALL